MSFAGLLDALAAPTDQQMAAPWRWPGRTGELLQVRDAHWRCVEAEQSALVVAPAPATRAEAILDLAQAAWGDLRGLIAGLPDGLFDRPPAAGEWPLSQLLAHVLLVERRYRVQVAYAVRRSDADPLRTSSPEALEAGEADGGAAEWIARIDAERSLSDAELRHLDATALLRPTVWAGYEVDVHFRLHRFGAHIAEHAIHAEKVLRALDHAPAEARQVVRRLSATRGAHERRTPEAVLARLDAEHAVLAASIATAT